MVRSLTLVVDKRAGLPREIRMGDTPSIAVQFRNFERIAKVEPDAFAYHPPTGVEVVDFKSEAAQAPPTTVSAEPGPR
jgi:outer membrane lipoprotein-sorting protein